jgi:transposase
MFIKTCLRKKNGKTYQTHYLVEGYRDPKTKKVKHKHILSLSKLPPKQILALQSSLQNNSQIEKAQLEDLELLTCKEYGNIVIFQKIFQKAFGKIIDPKYRKELEAITINKIFNPKSKNSLGNWLKEVDLNYSFNNKNTLYECLDYLEENQKKLEKKLARRAKGAQIDLLLYDITSTYFEGKGAENICKYGYSRDHRSDRAQVNIGLVTSSDGAPLSVEVFEGNIADKSTIENKIKSLQDQFGITNITFVFDRGMKSKTNLEYLTKQGFTYLTALSHAELRKRAEENKEIQMSIFDKQNLAEFIIREDPENNQKQNILENYTEKKLVLCHNPAKAKRDQINRLKLIEKTEEQLTKIQNLKRTYADLQLQDKVSKKINKYKCEKYLTYEIKAGKLIFERNLIKIEQAEKYDGFYMIETTKTKLKGNEAEKKYKSLQLVERAFNSVKNHIELRPVFHYKETRIKGHIFSCFMSYYLLHKFKEKTSELIKEYSLDSLLTELKCVKKSYFKINKFHFEKITQLNELQKKLFNLFVVQKN